MHYLSSVNLRNAINTNNSAKKRSKYVSIEPCIIKGFNAAPSIS